MPPRLKVIVPHVGSARPSVADRLNGFTKIPSTDTPLQKIDVYGASPAALRRSRCPATTRVPGLLAIASAQHLLSATDTPFTPPALIQAGARVRLDTDVTDDSRRRRLFTDNAERLFPPPGPLASVTVVACGVRRGSGTFGATVLSDGRLVIDVDHSLGELCGR